MYVYAHGDERREMNRWKTLFYERKREKKKFLFTLTEGGTEGKTGSPGGNLQAGINKNKKKERKKNKTLHLSWPKKGQIRLEVITNL